MTVPMDVLEKMSVEISLGVPKAESRFANLSEENSEQWDLSAKMQEGLIERGLIPDIPFEMV